MRYTIHVTLVDMKYGLEIVQRHWKWHHLIDRIGFLLAFHCHSTALSSIISETKRVEKRDFFIPPHPPAFYAPLKGSPSEYCSNVFTEKPEWCGYPPVEKDENMFIRFDTIHERDRQTDRQRGRHRTTA